MNPLKQNLARFLSVLLALSVFILTPHRAVGEEVASNLFLQGYQAVELGLKKERTGALKAALEQYRVAATKFERLKQKFPEWNPSVIDLRIKKTADMITGLELSIAKREGVAKETP
ncbi:hypothetical protein ACXR0O_01935 [Verrucomicrobiota bacterium sgz303538]